MDYALLTDKGCVKMSAIPYEFNPLGISSSFNLEKGLLFHAPLQENFDAFGGSLYSDPTSYGWTFQNYYGKSCVYGRGSDGIFYTMENPILGHIPFTMSIQFYTEDFYGGGGDNSSVFYIGRSTVNQTFGFQFQGNGNNYRIGTAWGDDFVFNPSPTVVDYLNAWTVFTATYDLEIIKLYFNGELRFVSDPVNLNIQKSTGGFSGRYGDLAIGSRWQDGRCWRNGLRNQYIYDYALSEQQVKLFYNATK